MISPREFFEKHRFIRRTLVGIASLAVLCLGGVLLLRSQCPAVSFPATGPLPEIPQLDGYKHGEESTFLTYPEWYIVYGSESYANFLKDQDPSDFPYLKTSGQFWTGYCHVFAATRERYPVNMGDHAMLWVIGTSYTVENVLKGVYEHTLGLLSEYLAGDVRTAEDEFAYQYNQRYVKFIYDRPWYEYRFSKDLGELWSSVPARGPAQFRKLERRGILTAELLVKTAYGYLIGLGTHATYGVAPVRIMATATLQGGVAALDSRVTAVIPLESSQFVVSIPRYREFSEIVPSLVSDGVQFRDIAGNQTIFFTAVLPDRAEIPTGATVLFREPMLTEPGLVRYGLTAPVTNLQTVLASLFAFGGRLEHLYDY